MQSTRSKAMHSKRQQRKTEGNNAKQSEAMQMQINFQGPGNVTRDTFSFDLQAPETVTCDTFSRSLPTKLLKCFQECLYNVSEKRQMTNWGRAGLILIHFY